MRVAVTGATGFIGRHVLAALRKRGDLSITVAGRTSFSAVSTSSSVNRVVFDITMPEPNAFVLLGRPEVLIHLAWGGLPNYKSLHHFESELFHQYRFLAGMVRSGLPALICTGTCFEYGMKNGELCESMDANPTNPYGLAKDTLRRQLELLRDVSPFNLTWARLFYMFGEGQSTRSLYSQLETAAETGVSEFQMSTGEQLRDYLPVTKVADHLVTLALDAPDSGVINVCSGKPVAVRSLVEGWIQQNQWKIDLALGALPYPDYEPLAFWGAVERLNSVLGDSL